MKRILFSLLPVLALYAQDHRPSALGSRLQAQAVPASSANGAPAAHNIQATAAASQPQPSGQALAVAVPAMDPETQARLSTPVKPEIDPATGCEVWRRIGGPRAVKLNAGKLTFPEYEEMLRPAEDGTFSRPIHVIMRRKGFPPEVIEQMYYDAAAAAISDEAWARQHPDIARAASKGNVGNVEYRAFAVQDLPPKLDFTTYTDPRGELSATACVLPRWTEREWAIVHFTPVGNAYTWEKCRNMTSGGITQRERTGPPVSPPISELRPPVQVPPPAQVAPPPTDVCPNIPGIQISVPPGLTVDITTGNCVQPPPAAPVAPPAPIIVQPAPAPAPIIQPSGPQNAQAGAYQVVTVNAGQPYRPPLRTIRRETPEELPREMNLNVNVRHYYEQKRDFWAKAVDGSKAFALYPALGFAAVNASFRIPKAIERAAEKRRPDVTNWSINGVNSPQFTNGYSPNYNPNNNYNPTNSSSNTFNPTNTASNTFNPAFTPSFTPTFNPSNSNEFNPTNTNQPTMTNQAPTYTPPTYNAPTYNGSPVTVQPPPQNINVTTPPVNVTNNMPPVTVPVTNNVTTPPVNVTNNMPPVTVQPPVNNVTVHPPNVTVQPPVNNVTVQPPTVIVNPSPTVCLLPDGRPFDCSKLGGAPPPRP